MGKPKSARVKAFERAIKRYDSRLSLHWGLHPIHVEAISYGIDWPYWARTFCWTIYQRIGSGSAIAPVYSVLTPDGQARDPIEELDIPALRAGHFRRHIKGKLTPKKVQDYREKVLGAPNKKEAEEKAEAKMLDYAMQEAKPMLDYAFRKNPDLASDMMTMGVR